MPAPHPEGRSAEPPENLRPQKALVPMATGEGGASAASRVRVCAGRVGLRGTEAKLVPSISSATQREPRPPQAQHGASGSAVRVPRAKPRVPPGVSASHVNGRDTEPLAAKRRDSSRRFEPWPVRSPATPRGKPSHEGGAHPVATRLRQACGPADALSGRTCFNKQRPEKPDNAAEPAQKTAETQTREHLCLGDSGPLCGVGRSLVRSRINV